MKNMKIFFTLGFVLLFTGAYSFAADNAQTDAGLAKQETKGEGNINSLSTTSLNPSQGNQTGTPTDDPQRVFNEAKSEDGEVTLRIDNNLLDGVAAKIHFYNKSGVQTGQWEYDKLMDTYRAPSPGGTYWVFTMYPREAGEIVNNEYRELKKIFILNNTGKELGSFETYGEVDNLPLQKDYFLSHEKNTIRAHDLTGRIIWERKLPEGADYQAVCEISPKGKYIALKEGKENVTLLDKSGKVLFRRKFLIAKNKFGRTALYVRDISVNGDVVLVPTGLEDKIVILDRKGETRIEKKTRGEAYHVKFSTSNSNEIIVEDREGKKEIIRLGDK